MCLGLKDHRDIQKPFHLELLKTNSNILRLVASAKSKYRGDMIKFAGAVRKLDFVPSADLCLIDLFQYRGNYSSQAEMTQMHGSLSQTLKKDKKLLALINKCD